jgi:hypothetical protein
VGGWIDHDPMALVTRPAVKRPDVRPPQVAQAEQLIDAAMAQDPELGLFLVLAVVLVTQLIASGVDLRTVSGRVGHRDGGRTTLGTYAHFQAAQDRQAAELMERLLRLPAAGAP